MGATFILIAAAAASCGNHSRAGSSQRCPTIAASALDVVGNHTPNAYLYGEQPVAQAACAHQIDRLRELMAPGFRGPGDRTADQTADWLRANMTMLDQLSRAFAVIPTIDNIGATFSGRVGELDFTPQGWSRWSLVNRSPQDFAGLWTSHDSSATIDSNGHAVFDWFVNEPLASPSASGDVRINLNITSVSGRTAFLVVTARDVPQGLNPTDGPGSGPNLALGKKYALTIEPPGLVGTGSNADFQWCDDAHYGDCGA